MITVQPPNRRWEGIWRTIQAVGLEGEEHARVWGQAVAMTPGYDTDRQILARPAPIIGLETTDE